MIAKDSTFSISPPSLDTLVQLPRNCPSSSGSNLRKRARSKWYTQAIAGKLLYLGSSLNKYYQRAYYCGQEIYQEGNQLKSSKYCNTRICHVCNRIRTAKLIRGYVNQLKGRNLFFVTLTLPNVKESELSFAIKNMTKCTTLILRKLRERKNIEVNGIRKIEVTYSPTRNDYHPHIHLLVDKGEKEIVQEWIKRNPTASIFAQDIRSADKDSLNELFKYATKISVKATVKGEVDIHIQALDIIMKSLFGKRSIQPFGDIKKVSEEVTDELESQAFDMPVKENNIWVWKGTDWISEDGECLTHYEPPDIVFKFKYFLN